jgi:HicB family
VRVIAQRRAPPYDVSAVSAAPERSPTSAVPSGRLLLRMPPDLHAELTQAAEREGKSLNAFITGRLAGSIGWGDGEGGDGREADRREESRLLPALLVANGVVVGLAAIVSVVILLIAWLA